MPSSVKWAKPRSKDGRKYRLRVDDATAERMGGIRQQNTAPELVVRRLLHAQGLRYRLHCKGLPGSPDIANARRKWAIFVHGCFWHRHPGCPHAMTPKRNREFWLAKLARNQARDAEAATALEDRGFQVLTIWECETQDETLLRSRISLLLDAQSASGSA